MPCARISCLGILFLLLFLCLPAKAQPQAATPATTSDDSIRTRLLLGARIHHGFIIIHSRHLAPIKDSYPWGAELDLSWQYLSQKAWEFCNCYPRVGFALTGWDWDNRQVLGHGLTGVVYVEPVFLTRYRLNLSIRMGGGLALLTRPYHITDNPLNLSYSTYLNFPLMVNLGLHFRLNPHWTLRANAAYNHISNGGIHLPNKGINYPTVGLGADYAFRAIDFKERAKRQDRTPPARRLRISLGALTTFKNAMPGDNDQYGVFGAYTHATYYIGRWSGLNLGAEWVSDISRRMRMNFYNLPQDHQRGAFLIGHEFLLGRVIFSQQLGIYFYDKWDNDDPVYQRFGLGVKLTDHLFLGFNLKTHRHVADFIDLRAAWIF